eukprot:CAMPEP_0168349364 /NCGR_PEP_ID=MMETSP0213-20121227/20363_1 /TAXON_ID=151035 /ORGANISM="Euplotes harpa, Strain FSP1.4" /LENGTH=116 /DNA_ID=CAMNT_0008359273 /DNA_START=679 /DNA_END=1029 /DNA_ORIENTATION=+
MTQLRDVLVLHLRVDDTLLPDLRFGRIRQMFLLDDLLDVELPALAFNQLDFGRRKWQVVKRANIAVVLHQRVLLRLVRGVERQRVRFAFDWTKLLATVRVSTGVEFSSGDEREVFA